MRTRLVVVFLVPLVGVLLALGGAYAWSAARSVQQEFFAERLGDLSYFVTSARQALRSGNATVIEGEVARYHDLYGARVAIVDRSGTPWVSRGLESNVLDEAATDKVLLALSGRRGETPQAMLPWSFTEAVMVEPVFNDGDVIGAVMLSTSMDAPKDTITRQWVLLAGASVLAIALGLLVVNRLANWVLQPVRRVDEAMEAIEQGHMEARIADDTGPPELRRMIALFNRMAEEIERVVSRQQEFALTASHELRNPLTHYCSGWSRLRPGSVRSGRAISRPPATRVAGWRRFLMRCWGSQGAATTPRSPQSISQSLWPVASRRGSGWQHKTTCVSRLHSRQACRC